MMKTRTMLKIPSVATPISARDWLAGLTAFRGNTVEAFERRLAEFLGQEHVFCVSSGTAAFYILLEALKRLRSGDEVVLPAYTAPSLTLPIRRAGLRPVLCDVSLRHFGFTPGAVHKALSSRTLCVVAVHMFGVPHDLRPLTKELRGAGINLIEDVASALGSTVNDRPLGRQGTVSFYSFNRGKNLTTVAGGAVATSNEDLTAILADQRRRVAKRRLGAPLLSPWKLAALSVAMRPLGYTLLHPWIRRFKYTTLHENFECFAYTGFQAGVGLSLLRKASEIFDRRRENGRYLLRRLANYSGVRLPEVPTGGAAVFNQFPVLVEASQVRQRLLARLMEAGIEATTLYPKPIHKYYPDLGDVGTGDPFPNASYVAEHLLLLPVHPFVDGAVLSRMVRVFDDVLPRRRRSRAQLGEPLADRKRQTIEDA